MFIQDSTQASKLLRILGRYLCENPSQQYVNSCSIRDITPSPWQVVSKCLTRAILALEHKFEAQLSKEAQSILSRYLEIVISAFKYDITYEDK